MTATELSGKIQTVLGVIDPNDLGITLPHEHLLANFKPIFLDPPEASQKGRAWGSITLEDLGWICCNWGSHWEHLGLFDEEAMIEEVSLFYRAGGKSLVEASNIGQQRDPMGLARISRATGLNIIMGSGYYVEPFQSEEWKQISEDAMAEQIMKDLLEGVGDTGLRAGIIGEVGCSSPWTETEKRSVRAAVRAQRETGAPLLIHPGRHPNAPQEITEVIAEAGGNLSRTIPDYKTVKKLAETGCYIEYDLFGLEATKYPFSPINMPNDGRRLDVIIQLIAEGHLGQILVAHDICFQNRLMQNGGHGYAHLLENVVPLMRRKGMTEEQINVIFIENPKRVLAFA